MNNDFIKRKIILCKRCNKEKYSFGLGMCSSCLRRTKRENRPPFYLGTCFSEMCRRVKTYDKLRPKYFGKSICTRDEFINRFIDDKSFLDLFKGWRDNNFQRKFAPSIDRIDNSLGYELNNLRFTSHYENSTKDIKLGIILKNRLTTLTFDTTTETALFLKTKRSNVKKYKNSNIQFKGWYIYEK